MLDHALEYTTLGWVAVPAIPGTKRTYVKWSQVTEPDANQVADWWTRWPQANIAVLCGPSRLIVIDVDDDAGYEILPPLPPTATTTTGRGQHHVYLDRSGGKVRNTAGRVFVHGKRIDTVGLVDVRGMGGLFIAPPSMHKSGKRYEWAPDAFDVGVRPAPHWLTPAPEAKVDRIELDPERDYSRAIQGVVDRVKGTQKGQRNAITFWAACTMTKYVTAGILEEWEAAQLILEAAISAGLSEQEAVRTIRSGMNRQSSEAGTS